MELKMSNTRIKERDLYYPTMKHLANAQDGFLLTSDLISRLEKELHPTGKDADIIEGRGDTYFSQKVRNIISHKDSPSNPIYKGWITYDSIRGGLEITQKGLDKVNN